jgi:hypothetical protein
MTYRSPHSISPSRIGCRPGSVRRRVAARYPDGLVPQGISAELIASRLELSHEDLDAFAAESHRRAAAAWSRLDPLVSLSWKCCPSTSASRSPIRGRASAPPG